MFSKINHVAIVSDNYAQLAQFYEAVFGMTTSAKTRPGRAVTVGDGYVGLNINPRRACRSGAGSALRSILPLGVSGSAGSATIAAGTMYVSAALDEFTRMVPATSCRAYRPPAAPPLPATLSCSMSSGGSAYRI